MSLSRMQKHKSIPDQSADCGIHFPHSRHEPTGQAHDDEPGNELHFWTTSSHCTPERHQTLQSVHTCT